MKIVKTFQLKIVIFTAVKYRCILHGNVFVMEGQDESGIVTLFQSVAVKSDDSHFCSKHTCWIGVKAAFMFKDLYSCIFNIIRLGTKHKKTY